MGDYPHRQKCFQQRCTEVLCPYKLAERERSACAAPGADQIPLAPPNAAPRPHQRFRFKYADEGRSAVVHATALAEPGATFHVATDARPPRLDIALPRGDLSLPRGTDEPYIYSCKTCETAEALDPVSLNVSGCLFTRARYDLEIAEIARTTHACRYYGREQMARVCRALAEPMASYGTAPEGVPPRGGGWRPKWRRDWEWWCAELWDSPERRWREASRPVLTPRPRRPAVGSPS